VRGPAGERNVTDRLEPQIGRKPQSRQLANGLAGQPSGAGLRPHLPILLEYQYLTPGLGEHLRCPKPRRAGTDDEVLDSLHGWDLLQMRAEEGESPLPGEIGRGFVECLGPGVIEKGVTCVVEMRFEGLAGGVVLLD